MSDFSRNLQRLRKRAGLSQERLAETLSVTRQTVSSWERGKSYPDLDTLLQLAEALRARGASGGLPLPLCSSALPSAAGRAT